MDLILDNNLLHCNCLWKVNPEAERLLVATFLKHTSPFVIKESSLVEREMRL